MVLQQLEETIAKDTFLQRVRKAKLLTASWLYSKPEDTKAEGSGGVEGGWDMVDLSSSKGDAPFAGPPADEEYAEQPPPFYADFDADVAFEKECVMVGEADATEAMADFIVQCVVMHPQAKELSPENLQVALTKTLGELRRSKVRSLWTWSKAVYKGTAWTYGVVNAYTHPWVVKAILMAVWHSMRMLFVALPFGV